MILYDSRTICVFYNEFEGQWYLVDKVTDMCTIYTDGKAIHDAVQEDYIKNDCNYNYGDYDLIKGIYCPFELNNKALDWDYSDYKGMYVACNYMTSNYNLGVYAHGYDLEELMEQYRDNDDVYFYYINYKGEAMVPNFG